MGPYLFLGVFVFVIAVTAVIVYHIGTSGLSDRTVVDAFELTCNITINEKDEISIYKLTVAGYLKTGEAYTGRIPPIVFQSFDLVTGGTIESMENIGLLMHINGGTEAVQYDSAYAFLEKMDIGRQDK